MLLVERLKTWALTALAVLLVLVGAYAMGGRASRTAADKRRLYEEALRSAAGSKDVHDAQVQVGKLPDGSATNQLLADWLRDQTHKPN